METMETVKPVPVEASENSNGSQQPSHPSEALLSADWELVRTVIPPYVFALSLLGLLFNTFVLGVFLAHKDRLTVAEIYLCNLALADFLLLCGLPFWAMNIVNDFNWSYGETLCKTVTSVIVINFYTSIYTLVMISIDRYLAIVKTMKARWLRRTLYAKVFCITSWILGVLMSLPTIVHRKVQFQEDNETMACILDYSHGSSWKFVHQTLLNLVGFVLPVLVIVFSSASIVRVLARRNDTAGLHETNDKKATGLLYAVTLVFILCWGPFQVFTFLDTLYDIHMLDEKVWSHALDVGAQVSVYLAFLNSVLNPLLYVFSGQYFRKKVCVIYSRAGRYRRGSDMTTYQRSVVSTYMNKTDLIKAVVISEANNKR